MTSSFARPSTLTASRFSLLVVHPSLNHTHNLAYCPTQSDAPALAVVDGNNAQGAVVGVFCMNMAMRKARETGVGWVVARNSNHYGIAGFYAMMAAKEGLIGESCVCVVWCVVCVCVCVCVL